MVADWLTSSYRKMHLALEQQCAVDVEQFDHMTLLRCSTLACKSTPHVSDTVP